MNWYERYYLDRSKAWLAAIWPSKPVEEKPHMKRSGNYWLCGKRNDTNGWDWYTLGVTQNGAYGRWQESMRSHMGPK